MPSCMNRFLRSASRRLACLSAAGLLLTLPALAQIQVPDLQQGQQTQQGTYDSGSGSGPVRLRQNAQGQQQTQQRSSMLRCAQQPFLPEYRLGEFEEYVQRLAAQLPSNPTPPMPADVQRDPNTTQNQQQDAFDLQQQRRAAQPKVRRLGAELMTPDPCLSPSDGPDYNPLVPADYIVQAGDELAVTLWGSVDADLRLTVDRSGSISIPRVGAIMVAGVRYAELREVISRRVAQVFKNFQLSVSLGQLRGVRIYITGFVQRPGAYSVSSLSTIAGALVKAAAPRRLAASATSSCVAAARW